MPVYRGRTRGTWRVVVTSDGSTRERIVRGSRRDAVRFEARMRLEAPTKTERRAGLTLDQLANGPYAIHAATHLRTDTWRVRQSQLRAVVARIGDVRAARLTAGDVEAYQAVRSAEVRASTVNNEVRVLLRVLRWARASGYDVAVPRVRRLKQPAPRVTAWTAEQIAALYDAARIECPHILPMLVVMANTGIRRGEALRAEWAWVDWPANLLRIPVLPDWAPKNGKARDVPLGATVKAALGPRCESGPLFPRLDGEPYREWPKELWQAARDRAGLTGGAHQLRHTFASHFLRTCPDLPLLSRVLGHSHARTTELYAHLLPGDLGRALDVVSLGPAAESVADGMAERPTPRRNRAKRKDFQNLRP